MPTTILWPSALDAPADLGPDLVELLRYDVAGEWPPGAERAGVLLVGWGSPRPVIETLDALESLELIQIIGTGFEDWIGHVPEGVLLSNARGAHGGATAEWAVLALLAVVRDLPTFVLAQQSARWRPSSTGTLVGSTVLVVGAGDLARELDARLSGFGAEVTLVGRTARGRVAGMDQLDELLRTSDAVVLMLPLTPDTTGLVDHGFLARMRDGAVLVNASRGAIVETDALVRELRSGRLRAALDVAEVEPLPPDDPLWSAPGLLLTPHVAGNTEGATERGAEVAVEQIRQFLRGATPTNVQQV